MGVATGARRRVEAKKARWDARRLSRLRNNPNLLEGVVLTDTGKVISSIKAKLPPWKWKVPEVDLRKYAITNPFDWRPVTRLKRYRHPKKYPIPALDRLVQRHYKATKDPPLKIDGEYKPLMYTLISTLISAPHNKAVVVIDLAHQFRASEVLKHAPWSYSKEPPAPRPVQLRSRFRPQKKPKVQEVTKKRKAGRQLGRSAKRKRVKGVRGLLPGRPTAEGGQTTATTATTTTTTTTTTRLPQPAVENHVEEGDDAVGIEGWPMIPQPQPCQPPWPFRRPRQVHQPPRASDTATQPDPISQPHLTEPSTSTSTGTSTSNSTGPQPIASAFNNPTSHTATRPDQRSTEAPEPPRQSDGHYLQSRPSNGVRKPTNKAGLKRKRASRTAFEASAVPLPQRLAELRRVAQPRLERVAQPRVRKSAARKKAERTAHYVRMTARAIYAAQSEYMRTHNGFCPKWLDEKYRHYNDIKDKMYPDRVARRWTQMATGRHGRVHDTEAIQKQIPYHVPGRPRPGTRGFVAVGQPKDGQEQQASATTSKKPEGKRGAPVQTQLPAHVKKMIAEKRRLAEKRWAANPYRDIIAAELKGTPLSRAEKNKIEARHRFETRGGAQLLAQLKAAYPEASSYDTPKVDFAPQPSLAVFSASFDGPAEYNDDDEEFEGLLDDDDLEGMMEGDEFENLTEGEGGEESEFLVEDDYDRIEPEIEESADHYMFFEAEESADHYMDYYEEEDEEEVDNNDDEGSFVFTGTQAREAIERRLAAGSPVYQDGEEEEADKEDEDEQTSPAPAFIPAAAAAHAPAPAPPWNRYAPAVPSPLRREVMGPPPTPIPTPLSRQVMGSPPRPAAVAATTTAAEEAAQQAAREAAELAAQRAAEEEEARWPKATKLHPQIGNIDTPLAPPWQPNMRVENPYTFNPETCLRVKRKRAASALSNSCRSNSRIRAGSEERPAWTLDEIAREMLATLETEPNDSRPKTKRQKKAASDERPAPRRSTTRAASEDMNAREPPVNRHEDAKAVKEQAIAEIEAKKRAEEEAKRAEEEARLKKIAEEAAAKKREEELAEQKRLEEEAAAEASRLEREADAAFKRSEELAAELQREEDELAAKKRAEQVASDGIVATEHRKELREEGRRKQAEAEAAGPSRQRESPFMKTRQAKPQPGKTPSGKVKQEKRQSAKSNKGKGKASSQMHGSQDVRSFFRPNQATPTRPDTPVATEKKEDEHEIRAREEKVQKVLEWVPYLDRRTILWDLERTDGNVEGTIDRGLDGRLEVPPPEYQAPPLPVAQSPSAAAEADPQGSQNEVRQRSSSRPDAVPSKATQQANSSEEESQQSSAASKSQSTSQEAQQSKSQEDNPQQNTAQQRDNVQTESREGNRQEGTSLGPTTQQAALQDDGAGSGSEGHGPSPAARSPVKKLDARSLAAPGQELEAKMDQLAPEVEARVGTRLLAAEQERATPKDLVDATVAIEERKNVKQQEESVQQHPVQARPAHRTSTKLPPDVQLKLDINRAKGQAKMALQLLKMDHHLREMESLDKAQAEMMRNSLKTKFRDSKHPVKPRQPKPLEAFTASDGRPEEPTAHVQTLDAHADTTRHIAKVVTPPTKPAMEAEACLPLRSILKSSATAEGKPAGRAKQTVRFTPASEAGDRHPLRAILKKKKKTDTKETPIGLPKRTVKFAPAVEQVESTIETARSHSGTGTSAPQTTPQAAPQAAPQAVPQTASSSAPQSRSTPVASAPTEPTVKPLKQDPSVPFTLRRVDPEDLKHVYVVRTRNHPKNVWPEAEGYQQTKRLVDTARTMIREGKHNSHDREIWGTIIIGHKRSQADDPDFEADVVCGTVYGWLNVKREFIRGFQPDLPVQKYLAARDMRNRDRQEADNYYGTSPWAQIAFNDKGLAVETWDRLWIPKRVRRPRRRARFARTGR